VWLVRLSCGLQIERLMPADDAFRMRAILRILLVCDPLLPSLDSTATPGAMPNTSPPSIWSSATAFKEVSSDRKDPIGVQGRDEL
jgi:hypothetical protein